MFCSTGSFRFGDNNANEAAYLVWSEIQNRHSGAEKRSFVEELKKPGAKTELRVMNVRR